MRRLPVVVLLALFAGVAVLALAACAGKSGPSGESGAKAVLYHCPMHPSYTSDRPGDCPICNMRLVPVGSEDADAEHASGATGPEGGPALYRCPMHPEVTSDRPGECPICGMDLVADPAPAGAAPGLVTVTLSPERRQAIGVRTQPVVRGPLLRTIRAAARVAVDERHVHHVHTKFEGWIEDLYVNVTGQPVRKGQPLFTVYSPEVLSTQNEFAIALRTARELRASREPGVAEGAARLLDAARTRLRHWDIPEARIRDLEAGGEPVRAILFLSHEDGVVLEKTALPGMKVMPGDDLFTIADLRAVWVLADLYDYELPYLREGQEAVFRLSYLPGEERRGTVSFIYPVLDPGTRTVKVRMEFENPDLLLKPEMYGEVGIVADLGERLLVPDTALLHSGERDIAFVDLGGGRFEPREVKVGVRSREGAEVLSGLSEGESVVVSANFFVDAESQLKAALAAMGGAGAPRTEGGEAGGSGAAGEGAGAGGHAGHGGAR